MSLFRKKPVEVEAVQWFKIGDHPLDYTEDQIDPASGIIYTAQHRKEAGWEGEIVRYFRRPEDEYAGSNVHPACGATYHDHGWIDTGRYGHTVCPGDWIVLDTAGEFYPVRPDVFQETYEAVEVPT